MEAPTVDLDWHPTPSGGYSRQADTLESLFMAMHDKNASHNRSHLAISSTVKLSFPASTAFPEFHLKEAWWALRRAYPTIAATTSPIDPANPITGGHTITTMAPSDKEFVENTFFTYTDDGRNAAEIAEIMTTAHLGTLHWIPATREQLLHVAYWQVDEIGTLMLWGTYLSLVASNISEFMTMYPISDGDCRLTESSHKLVKAATSEETTSPIVRKLADDVSGRYPEALPSIGPPLKPRGKRSAEPGSAHTISHKLAFPVEGVRTLGRGCNQTRRHYGVTAAIIAAIIRALSAYPQDPEARHFTALMPTNFRPVLPKPYDWRTQAMGVRNIAWPLQVTDVKEKTFEETANTVEKHFRSGFWRLAKDDEGEHISIADINAAHSRRLLPLLADESQPGLLSPPTLWIVDLVRPMQHVGDAWECDLGEEMLVVEDFWMKPEVLSKEQVVHMWEWRNERHVQISANAAYFDESQLSEELERVRSELELGLEVGEVLCEIR